MANTSMPFIAQCRKLYSVTIWDADLADSGAVADDILLPTNQRAKFTENQKSSFMIGPS